MLTFQHILSGALFFDIQSKYEGYLLHMMLHLLKALHSGDEGLLV